MTGPRRAPYPAIEGGWFTYWIKFSVLVVLGGIAVFAILLAAAVVPV